MDPALGVCIGCCRTLDEIARWSAMTNEERDEVLSVLPTRRANLSGVSVNAGDPAR